VTSHVNAALQFAKNSWRECQGHRGTLQISGFFRSPDELLKMFAGSPSHRRLASGLAHAVGTLELLVIWLITHAAFGQIALSAAEGDDLLGHRPSAWGATNWLHSSPLTLDSLAGKVVLVRWWTAPTCPYCAATAPALNEFDETFRERGLTVIGMYHHKAPTPLDTVAVGKFAGDFGFKFPVAIDPGWRTLDAWWLKDHRRRWTSVTFVLDRKGVIRFIHPGGKHVKGDAAYREIRAMIETLLNEK
jgi:peroxiredoxin